MWWTKRRRAQSNEDFETWVEGGVCPTLNAFDNTGDSRATVLISASFKPGSSAQARSIGYEEEMAPTLEGGGGGNNKPAVVMAFHPHYHDGARPQGDVINTITSRWGTGGNNMTMIVFSHTQGLDAQPSEVASPTLRSNGRGMAIMYDNGTVDNEGITVAFPIQDGREIEKHQNGLGVGNQGDPSYTLDQTGAQSVAVNFDEFNFTGGEEIHHAIRSGTRQSTGLVAETVVRRLTPTECERLMGWPDDHTLYRADGKTNSDSTRYKMCGNGVATPVAHWIAEQIKPLLEKN
jgi:site-specific DNA-cytosine methylase